MAGLMPVQGMRRGRSGEGMLIAAAVLLVPLLTWSTPARAGWFVRDNQIAYQLSRQGHDRQSLDHWDDSAEGLYGKGTALMHLGRMREAERAFRQSLAVAPHKTGFSDDLEMPQGQRPGFMASLWYNLGNTLYAQGELAEARQAWLKALHFQPGHAKASHNLEIVDRVLGQRARNEQQPLASLSGAQRKQAGKNKKSPAHGSPPQPQQRTAQHGLLPLHRTGGSEQAGPSGAPGPGKHGGGAGTSRLASGKQGRQVAMRRHAHRLTAHPGATPAAGKGGGRSRPSRAGGRGISPEQASRELGMVNEGVSVFLRHRLREKSSQSVSGAGGKPW